MKKLAMFLMVMILPASAQPATAQGIFGGGLFAKKPRANPLQRVPELIVTLKTDQDERHRSQAAAELGSMDANTFGEVVPVLVDALQSDSRSGVRMEAASSLGSIRPVSQMAGQALERAAAQDENLRVRWHAKGILVKYRLAGYSASTPGNAKPGRTDEPPLYIQNTPTVQHQATQPLAIQPQASQPQTVQPPIVQPQTVQPQAGPLLSGNGPAPALFPNSPSKAVTRAPAAATVPPAPSKTDGITPEYRPSTSRPLPQGSFTTSVPQQPVRSAPEPLPMVEGPALAPPPPPQRTPF